VTSARRRRFLWIAAGALLFLAACGADEGGPLIERGEESAAADYLYVIPEGTADDLAAGEPVQIIPGNLEVRVGELIRVVNEDDEGHFVGIFFVGAGETVTQRFASPGEFEGNCSIHPSGRLVLTVRE
jgi:plastocyanin